MLIYSLSFVYYSHTTITATTTTPGLPFTALNTSCTHCLHSFLFEMLPILCKAELVVILQLHPNANFKSTQFLHSIQCRIQKRIHCSHDRCRCRGVGFCLNYVYFILCASVCEVYVTLASLVRGHFKVALQAAKT